MHVFPPLGKAPTPLVVRNDLALMDSLDADAVRLPAAIRTALEDVSAPPFSYPERRSDR